MRDYDRIISKEDMELINDVYCAVFEKPYLLAEIMQSGSRAVEDRIKYAEKRAADAEAVTVSAVCMAGKKATPSMKKWCEDMFGGYLLEHPTSFNWKNCKGDIDDALVKTFGEEE